MLQITLNQTEIEIAVKNYIQKRMVFKEGTDIQIDMKASRGAEGFTAIIDVNYNDEDQNLQEQEKERITKAKEEQLQKAGSFLGKTAEIAREARAKSESKEEDTKSEEPWIEEEAVTTEPVVDPETAAAQEIAKPSKPKASIFKNTVAPK